MTKRHRRKRYIRRNLTLDLVIASNRAVKQQRRINRAIVSMDDYIRKSIKELVKYMDVVEEDIK